MLIELKLKNFRQHKDRTFTFTQGLNVLRGANEAGKSGLLEAIGYAYFGVKACRQSLEDVVTWGEDVKTLRVDLTFAVDSVTYALKRSKGGAELRWGNGQTVVGQNEVTAFIGRLFGTAPANIPNLILSGQGDIRGALDRGPKAATELIEDLADFGIIDKIITLIGERLLTGPTKPFEEKIACLTPELADLEQALANVPDTRAEEDELAALRQTIESATARCKEHSAAVAPVAAERDRLRAVLVQRDRAQDRLRMRHEQNLEADLALNTLVIHPPAPPDGARIEEIRSLLADAERLERARTVRDEIAGIVYSGDEWTSDDAAVEAIASFNAETHRIKTRSTVVQGRLNELSARAREERAKRITASACGLCGKDVSQLPEVKSKNAAIDATLAAIVAEEAQLRAELTDLIADLRAMDALAGEHGRIEKLVAKFGELAAIDKAQVPWKLSYAGPEIPQDGRAGALRLELNGLVRAAAAITAWEAKIEAAKVALLRASAAAAEANTEATKPEYAAAAEELPVVEAQYDEINRQYTFAVNELNYAKEGAASLDAEIREKRAVYEAAQARVTDVKSKLEDAKKDLDAVIFNNALLARVRAARPVIANKLWSKVLSTVSRYFSTMRGAESGVTKDADGFKVNGKEIAGLSGSTKDILGLAIRLALVKVFLPHAPFLILDEPSAACDTPRTESMTGFLSSAGFDQMLVVTHDDTIEQVATTLIEI